MGELPPNAGRQTNLLPLRLPTLQHAQTLGAVQTPKERAALDGWEILGRRPRQGLDVYDPRWRGSQETRGHSNQTAHQGEGRSKSLRWQSDLLGKTTATPPAHYY